MGKNNRGKRKIHNVPNNKNHLSNKQRLRVKKNVHGAKKNKEHFSFLNSIIRVLSFIKGPFNILVSVVLTVVSLVKKIFLIFFRGIKIIVMGVFNFFQKIIVWTCRRLKIIVHRYLILFFLAFFVSHKLLFSDPFGLNVFHFRCALVILASATIFLGNRGAWQSFFICLGFFISMMYYGMNDIFHCFLNNSSDNIFKTYCVETIILIAITILPLLIKFFTYIVSEKPDKKWRKDLFPDRLDLYDKISTYLSNHSVLAIDSPYGNGKSTIVEALKNEKEKKEKWNFITIGILSTTVENVELCIVREINQVLESKGIFLNPISKIKAFFSHDFTYCIGDLLFENQSYEKQIQSFVDGIQSLKKVIVLNFEDIDRITNKEHLNKIFSICDTLVKYDLKYKSRYIKVIYQCNIDTLNKLYEEDYGDRYIEKYIPQSYSLGILLGEFFKNVLERNLKRYGKIKKVSFDFLSRKLKHGLLQQELSLNLVNHTVRGIEQILDKVNSYFETEKNISVCNEPAFEAVVIFYLAKYYYPYICDLFEKKVDMDHQKLFYPNSKNGYEENISLIELREKIITSNNQGTNILTFFDKAQNKMAKENHDALLFLTLLGYDDEYYKCQSILGDSDYIDNLGRNISSDNDMNQNRTNREELKRLKRPLRYMKQREKVLQQLIKLHL